MEETVFFCTACRKTLDYEARLLEDKKILIICPKCGCRNIVREQIHCFWCQKKATICMINGEIYRIEEEDRAQAVFGLDDDVAEFGDFSSCETHRPMDWPARYPECGAQVKTFALRNKNGDVVGVCSECGTEFTIRSNVTCDLCYLRPAQVVMERWFDKYSIPRLLCDRHIKGEQRQRMLRRMVILTVVGFAITVLLVLLLKYWHIIRLSISH